MVAVLSVLVLQAASCVRSALRAPGLRCQGAPPIAEAAPDSTTAAPRASTATVGAAREILCAALSGASSENSQWGPPLDPLVVLVCCILAQPIMPSIICSMNVPTDSTDKQHVKVIQMSTFKKKKTGRNST